MKRVGVYLPDELYEELRKEAFDKYLSMSGLIVKKLGGQRTFNKTVLKLTDEKNQGLMYDISKATVSGVCKHGAMKGLCKMGC